MNNKKIFLFDLDGTLVDSMPQWANKITAYLDQKGIEYPCDIVNKATPLGDRGIAELFISMGAKGTAEEIVEEMNAISIKAYENDILLKKGVKEFLQKASLQGISLNLLTASPHCMLIPCLKRNGVYDLFDNLWSCGDFGMKKSEPEIYFKVAEKLNAKVENITFFDDNVTAVKTGKEAGLFVVGVYDEFSLPYTEEIKSAANLYIETFEGLSLDDILK